MGRLQSFLFGVVVGGAAVFGALKYHVVRADDGIHVVPKVAPGFQDVYVDIRDFRVEDWDKHRGLSLALVQANKSALMKGTAADYFRESLDSVLRALGRAP